MADFIRFDFNSAPVERLMHEFPEELEHRLLEEGRETAERLADTIRLRLHQSLSPDATGKTEHGIAAEVRRDGRGYVVVARRNPFPMLPRWLEHGTKHMPAHDFFDTSAAIEEGPYLRRVDNILAELIDEKGLGD
jgi:hypothetical protein